MSLYQGVVVAREKVTSRDGTSWTLIYTKNNSRPLAIRNGSVWPANGSVVSAEVSPGAAWDFATSREVSIDSFPVKPYELEKRIPGVGELLRPLILDWLRWHRTCSSDDVYDKAMEIIKPLGRDPRVLGTAFQDLSRRKVIRRVGFVTSKRSTRHQCPTMSVWEMVRRESS